MTRHWIDAMAEKAVRSILDAFNRSQLGDLTEAHQIARDFIREVISDSRLVVMSDLEESWARIPEVEVDK